MELVSFSELLVPRRARCVQPPKGGTF